MKHPINKRLAEVVDYLASNKKGFTIKSMADLLGITQETFRRMRLGLYSISCEQMITIIDSYGVNPYYIMYGTQPMFLEDGKLAEPTVPYQKSEAQEIEIMKKSLADKDKIIALLEQQLKNNK
jgi:hypothetical protein